MAKKINWTFPAFEMLYEILEYKSEFNAINAEKYIDKVFAFCENFSTFPNSNPVCRFSYLQEKGYHCAIFDKQYIIIYRVLNQIDILAIVHTSRSPESYEGLGV